MMIMPQTRFLEFLAGEAEKYAHFRLVLGARVQRLIDGDGTVRGVAYPTDDGRREVRAQLTVATDGRFSRVRRLAQLEVFEDPAEIAEADGGVDALGHRRRLHARRPTPVCEGIVRVDGCQG
jgi:2-polyprenyl-6-methoxyphenol hydroxylase-like FAD-dependent oxidoreductase